MAYYDRVAEERRLAAEAKYLELRQWLREQKDGKLNEMYMADVHLSDMEKELSELRTKVDGYKKFFAALDNLLPKRSSIHDVIR